MPLTLGSTLAWNARYLSQKEALVASEPGKARQAWTFAALDEEVSRHAHALRSLGVGHGDVVATFLGNTPSMVFTLLAAARLGAVFCPIDYRLDAAVVAFVLQDSQAKALVTDAEGMPVLERVREQWPATQAMHWLYAGSEAAAAPVDAMVYLPDLLEAQPRTWDAAAWPVDENDAFLLAYGKGRGPSALRPKGVLHTHRTKLAHNMLVQQSMLLRSQDVGLCLAPLSQGKELCTGFLPRLQMGITQVLQRRFDAADALRLMRQEGVTTFCVKPWMISELLKVPELMDQNLKRLRLVAYAGPGMVPSLHRKWQAQVGCALLQIYGALEMGPCMAVLHPVDHLSRVGSAGVPAFGYELVVAKMAPDGSPSHPDHLCEPGQTGEVLVKSPYMMMGYLGREQDSVRALEHGWFHTGDVGQWDTDGYLWLMGRRDALQPSMEHQPAPTETTRYAQGAMAMGR